jgi:hypothetical protein
MDGARSTHRVTMNVHNVRKLERKGPAGRHEIMLNRSYKTGCEAVDWMERRALLHRIMNIRLCFTG